MTEQADHYDKGLRMLLEALTAISYLKAGEGRAAAIAEYALDQYEKALRNVDAYEDDTETQGFSGHDPERRSQSSHRRFDRTVNSGPPLEQTDRRFGADRRVNPDRRCKPLMTQ